MRIKTKEALKDIKVFDRAKNLAQKSKSGLGELNREADETQGGDYSSESQYAGDNLQHYERRLTDDLVHGTEKAGKWGVRETRKVYQRKHGTGKMVSDSQKAIQTAERAGKTAKKTAKTTAKASKKAVAAMKKAAEEAIQATKAIIKATIEAVKATIAAIKELVALIAAGGWVAVVIIVIICAVGLIASSVYAIFIPKDNGVSIQSVMRECEREREEWIEQLKVSVPYDCCHIEGQRADWKEVVAVWAVMCNVDVDEPENLAVLDEKAVKKLKSVYSEANRINAYAETKARTETVHQVAEDGTVIEVEMGKKEIILHIKQVVIPLNELIEKYKMSRKQIEVLNYLLTKIRIEQWEEILLE